MLIYNHNKEFVGVDEGLLRTLGFSTLADMQAECKDFADLFIKKPGYIHNFQNFQWIDFVLHSESDRPKAIINAKGKGFEVDIVIKPFFFADEASGEGYLIALEHVKPLGALEGVELPETSAAVEPDAMPTPAAPEPTPAPTMAEPTPAPAEPVETFTPPEPTPAPAERATLDIPEMDIAMDTTPEPEETFPDFNKPLEIEDDLFLSEEEAPSVTEEPSAAPEAAMPEPTPEPTPAPQPAAAAEPSAAGPEGYFTPEEAEIIATLQTSSDYVYDPQVASDELGLPVDLIEEFIGDFIGQAHDFHDELFTAAGTSDFENVQLLSHKLKGVAANLRIEDALETLTNVNTSKEQDVVEANLKQFYRIIAKLEGKDVPGTTVATPAVSDEPETPLYGNYEPEFDIKEEESPIAAEAPSAEDDLYNFDLPPADAPEEETAVETPEVEDDLYNFDMPPADTPAEPAGTSETAEDDDLYNFDLPPLDEETTDTAVSNDDLYSMDAPAVEETPSDFGTEPTLTAEEEFELPPMDETPLTEPEPTPAATSEVQYDLTKAANELGLSSAVVQELVDGFVEEANQIRGDFDSAIDAGQSSAWHDCALQLKGITDNLRMHEISAELEALIHTDDALKAGDTVAQLYSHINKLHS